MWKRRIQETQASFAAKPEELPQIRNLVENFCRDSAVPPKEISKILLAIEEACSNVIRHAYLLGPGDIKLKIARKRDQVTFSIKDQGRSFEVGRAKRVDLKKYIQTERKGGLGLQLIEKIMDEVTYEARNGENELKLSKRLDGPGLKKSFFLKDLPWKTKLTLSFGLIFSLSVLVFYIYDTKKLETQLKDRILRSSLELAETIATAGKDYLFSKEDLALANLLYNSQRDRPEIAYLLILDSEGTIWGTSGDQKEVLSTYRPPRTIDQKLYHKPQRYFDQNLGYVYHVIKPVGEGKKLFGAVHLGVLESEIQAQIRSAKPGLNYILILMGGWIAILVSAVWLVKPLRRLSLAVRRAKERDWEPEIAFEDQAELGEIAQSFKEISLKFKEAQKELSHEKLKQEIELVSHIQQVLLPQSIPVIEGFEIATIYKSALEVSGDYFDFFWLDPQNLGMVVGDVAGKGLCASLYMSMLRTALRAIAPKYKDPKPVLVKTDQLISPDLKKGHFVTVFYLILNIQHKKIVYASAGHNPLILFRPPEKKFYFLNPKGMPLGLRLPKGVSFEQSLESEVLYLVAQDWLLIYTDGITEAMNSEGQAFGKERFLDFTQQNFELPALEFTHRLQQTLTAFTEGRPPSDDITLVAIKEVGQPGKEVFSAQKEKTLVQTKPDERTP